MADVGSHVQRLVRREVMLAALLAQYSSTMEGYGRAQRTGSGTSDDG
jgi:hypothetical protein